MGSKRTGGNGGPGGIRTPDLVNAIHTRSQLRHRPTDRDSLFQYTNRVGTCQRRGMNPGSDLNRCRN